MEQFFILDKVNEGTTIPLDLPNGEPTAEWVQIRGADSDHFKKAERQSMRRIVEIKQNKKLSDEEKEELFNKEETLLIGELIIAWSFDAETTPDNKYRFLKNAPQIAELINKTAVDRKAFFSNGSKCSETTQNESSDCNESQKALNKL